MHLNRRQLYVQTEITEIDRAKKRVHTAQGHIDYDWLVLSAGTRDGFEAWFGNDRKAIDYTRANDPTAYIPSAEHGLVKQKIRDFTGGTFVLTLPPPPHRRPPSPYERACLMAWWYKTNKVPAKIVILDPKPRIAPITAGYRQAFDELYPDMIAAPGGGPRVESRPRRQEREGRADRLGGRSSVVSITRSGRTGYCIRHRSTTTSAGPSCGRRT